jgi:DNA-binding NtrC family response regulator
LPLPTPFAFSRNGTAEMLGINRSTLWSRMKKLGIEMPKRGGAPASD